MPASKNQGISPFRTDACAGRVVLVTGGGSGIGFEITKQLGLHGASVAIMGRRTANLESALVALKSEGINAFAVQGDVRTENDAVRAVGEVVGKFGRLDTLVNCAAGNFLAVAEELRPKGFRTVIEIDTIGSFNMCYAAFNALKESGQGVILNISATLHYGASWYQTHASAAKAAIDSMTRSLGLEWGTYKIRVVGIAPGPIAGTAGLVKLSGSEDTSAIEEMVKEAIPLQKLGTTWDIAMSALFLVSEGGRNITGETVVCDGGQWLYRLPPAPREAVSGFSRKIESTSRNISPATKGKL